MTSNSMIPILKTTLSTTSHRVTRCQNSPDFYIYKRLPQFDKTMNLAISGVLKKDLILKIGGCSPFALVEVYESLVECATSLDRNIWHASTESLVTTWCTRVREEEQLARRSRRCSRSDSRGRERRERDWFWGRMCSGQSPFDLVWEREKEVLLIAYDAKSISISFSETSWRKSEEMLPCRSGVMSLPLPFIYTVLLGKIDSINNWTPLDLLKSTVQREANAVPCIEPDCVSGLVEMRGSSLAEGSELNETGLTGIAFTDCGDI